MLMAPEVHDGIGVLVREPEIWVPVERDREQRASERFSGAAGSHRRRLLALQDHSVIEPALSRPTTHTSSE